jgi:hypothetical protein
MFYGCSSLTQAPALPATTLAYGCYCSMFEKCASLTQAPELPATTLATNCYYVMFKGCTALTQAPELPATTLATGCYKDIFEGCISIPEPKYKMPNLTFDEVKNEILKNYNSIFDVGGTYKIQCSDKILVATYDEDYWEWKITEG